MISTLKFNFQNYQQPKIMLSSRNLTGSTGKLSKYSFFITELTSTGTKRILKPNVGYNFTGFASTKINAVGDVATTNIDPTTVRSTSGYTVGYDSTLYTISPDTTNTGIVINNIGNLYQNMDIEIDLTGLYTFVNGNKYGIEAEAVTGTGGSTSATWSWNYPSINYYNSTAEFDTYADIPQTLYLTVDTSDVDPSTGNTVANGSSSDWGFQNVNSTPVGYALIAMEIAAGQIANNDTVTLNLLNNGTTPMTLPTGSRVIIWDAAQNIIGTTPVNITLNDSTFGITNNQFSFSGVDTSKAMTLGFAIPSSTLLTNTINAVLKVGSATIAETGNTQIACLYEDSEVLTPSGYVSVKQLQNGDLVTTSDGRTSRIVNIMKSKFPASENTSPIIIPANSIAENYPPKDCRISKYHMIQYNGNWIAPLKNKHIFKTDKSVRSVKYYHIQLENYYADHLVINGGLIVESLGNGEKDNTAEWDARVNNSIIL